ncbi:ferredoxin-dependent bilin reductase [Nitzschia inconspicua]|uniref:Ferredoxin-dependent bilin reductase n=1 Tax=Nitzschia inconspicua TaxID=303405 RepID=A0A9K3LFG7_9STRA|nr:ferredoxin-dependent bilin reductase [Nitzschia inconspicua]
MKPQHLLLLAPVACAYTLQHQQRHPTFTTGTPINAPRQSLSSANLLRMDTEVPSLDTVTTYNLEKTLKNIRLHKEISLRQAEAQHGMPWKSSIDPKVKDEELLYMPFWEWQMQFMEENFTNLKVVPCHNGKTDFSYNANEKMKARIVNLCATSDEYRKIRMTYYDAGDNTQVFNAVLYPDAALNLPVLGVDILCFNRKKYLAIVDFQPIHDNEEDHAAPYEHLLKPIKEKYDSLKGRMSSKFYDETQHFSQQMLFARFDDEEIVSRELFPAFQSYVKTHLDLVRSTERRPEDVTFVLECQKDYDTYSADRDPATGLFAAMFGAEWADDFVHDFLFSMSERTEGGPPPSMPFTGGPPPGAAAGQPQPPLSAGAPQMHSHKP